MMNIMKIKTVLTGIFLLAGALCAAELQPREWMIDGVKREALIYVPQTTNSIPLVFVFHGHGGTMQRMARSFHIHDLWPEAAVVYMQGLPTPGILTDPEGKKNGWNAQSMGPDNRDLKFFDTVLRSLEKEYRIDSNRVYCTGHSNGGGFTYLLWAARGNVFAAVAPSAAASAKVISKLEPKPVLHLAGENDPLVKYKWQALMMAQDKRINGCSETGEPWASSGDLTGTLYPSAAGTSVITLIHPGGHTFPKEAPELIVRFFKMY
ncbi:MAG: PHB depolymerase family esterase [Kiritimatiellales bacterium]